MALLFYVQTVIDVSVDFFLRLESLFSLLWVVGFILLTVGVHPETYVTALALTVYVFARVE